MSQREKYIHRRLMELACIADTRELDTVERDEERMLNEELKNLLSDKLKEQTPEEQKKPAKESANRAADAAAAKELRENLDDVVDIAAKSGEKVVAVECPCCGKFFYATESEAAYSQALDEDPQKAANSGLYVMRLGRKCPFCGYSGSVTPNICKGLAAYHAENDKRSERDE